ncbi:MAG TPA: ATP-binding protein [Sporichthya sp.]|nr:ATP-binding protein [Sporichthya sp.]
MSSVVERRASLPQQTDSPALARRLVGEVLDSCGRPDLRAAAELALTELVTNAILHAHTGVSLRVRCDGHALSVEVEDFNTCLPVPHSYGPESSTGRGMALVAALSREHGVIPTAGGKIVWFSVTDDRLPGPEASADDLLAAWADPHMPPNEAAGGDASAAPRAILTGFPPTLWLAAAQQHDAMLRELALFRAGAGHAVDDLAAADRARARLRSALERALREARETGQERRSPPGPPAPLKDVEPVLDLTVPLAGTTSADFAALQDVLDEAQGLAHSRQLLVAPALPEIVAVRDWAAEQVITTLAGLPPRPWPGADAEHFARSVDPDARDIDYDIDARLRNRTAIVVNEHNRIVGISAGLASDLGWTVEGLVGRRVVAIIPPRFREAHTAGFTRHLTSGEAHALRVELELPVMAADGTEVPYTLFIEADRTRSGRPVYIASLSRMADLT